VRRDTPAPSVYGVQTSPSKEDGVPALPDTPYASEVEPTGGIARYDAARDRAAVSIV